MLVNSKLKQNAGTCHHFTDHREVETIETRLLITQDRDWYQQHVPRCDTLFIFGGKYVEK